MTLVSITAVGAFDAVGVILVVALMVTPASAAYLLTSDLRKMLLIAVSIGVASAVGGYWLAHFLNANIAGAMATFTGFLFLLTFLLAPQRGILAVLRRRQRQRLDFAQTMLAIHLLHHEGKPEAQEECRVDHLLRHIRWQPAFAANVVRYAERQGTIHRQNDLLWLTNGGRDLAAAAMVQ